MEIPVSPITMLKSDAEKSDRYLILDGSPFPNDRTIPDEVMAALEPMLFSTPDGIEEKYPVDGTSVPFCTVISSPVAINPADGSIAVPHHVFRDDNIFPTPGTQFLSEVEGTQQFFIGILLGAEVPPLTLDGVDITVRVPSEGLGEFKFGTGLHPNMVPVPKSYQIFGTMDVLADGQNLDDLRWSPITPIMTATPERWSFATPTKHRFNSGDTEGSRPREKYRGFKLVVFDWDDTNAQPGDMSRGISRLKFVFNPNELAELNQPSITYLPDLTAGEGEVVAFDLLGCLADDLSNVLADGPPAATIDTAARAQLDIFEEKLGDLDSTVATLNAQVAELNVVHNSNSTAWAEFSRKVNDELDQLASNLGALKSEEENVTPAQMHAAIADEIAAAKASLLETVESELDALVVSPVIVRPSQQRYSLTELYKQHGYALDKIMAVSGEGTTILVLADKPSDADTLTVDNCRVDGGKVLLASPKHKIRVIYEKNIIGLYNQVTLTDPGESITLMFYDNQWIGKISS